MLSRNRLRLWPWCVTLTPAVIQEHEHRGYSVGRGNVQELGNPGLEAQLQTAATANKTALNIGHLFQIRSRIHYTDACLLCELLFD